MEIVDKSDIKKESMTRKTRSDDMFLKEDLEKYYIHEKKSIAEISEIYDCSWSIVKRKLKKYEISIRPRGSFLTDDDGETLRLKYNRGEISCSEYRNKLVNIKGYDSITEYQNNLAKSMGYKNWKEHKDELVKSRGYENFNDYQRKMRYKRGSSLPMSENEDCSQYLGVYIAEKILPLLFENVEKMPDGNPGFDFICINDYKIDVKSACLVNYNDWSFDIKKNKIADYFLMISFNSRENLNVQHIWLVKGDAAIEKTNAYLSKGFIFNEKHTVHIGVGERALRRWKKYEITDKLEEIQKVCDNFKNNNK